MVDRFEQARAEAPSVEHQQMSKVAGLYQEARSLLSSLGRLARNHVYVTAPLGLTGAILVGASFSGDSAPVVARQTDSRPSPEPSPNPLTTAEGRFSVDGVCMDDLEFQFPHTQVRGFLPRANMNGLIFVRNAAGDVAQSPLEKVVPPGSRAFTIKRYARDYSGDVRNSDRDVPFEKGQEYEVTVVDLENNADYHGTVKANC